MSTRTPKHLDQSFGGDDDVRSGQRRSPRADHRSAGRHYPLHLRRPHKGRLASLSVDGLPAGVTAAFVPPRIGPGQSAQMLVNAAMAAGTGTAAFTVTAVIERGEESRRNGAIAVLAGGRNPVAARGAATGPTQ